MIISCPEFSLSPSSIMNKAPLLAPFCSSAGWYRLSIVQFGCFLLPVACRPWVDFNFHTLRPSTPHFPWHFPIERNFREKGGAPASIASCCRECFYLSEHACREGFTVDPILVHRPHRRVDSETEQRLLILFRWYGTPSGRIEHVEQRCDLVRQSRVRYYSWSRISIYIVSSAESD